MMDRPSSNAAPARRRITPIAVTSQDQVISAAFANEQPLRVGPAPSKGSTKEISQCGRGRRIWVDIHNDITVKFKDVLRQQGLDHATWRKGLDQSKAQLEGAPQGADAKRQGFTGRLYQRVQGLYEASDDTESSGQDLSDHENGTGSDAAANGGAGADAAGSDGDDEEEDDDDEEEKEGDETGAEIDIANELNKPKKKRQRFERYDDDFIDDSELIMVKGEAKELKTKYSGFYVTEGDVELLAQPDKPSKPRSKPRPRASKAAAPAPAAGETAAAAVAPAAATQPSKAASGKKRQAPEQQQQSSGAMAAAEAPKRKKQRSETPTAAAAAGVHGDVKPNAAADSASDPAGPSAAAATTGPGTAGKAMAAVLAARNKKKPHEPTNNKMDSVSAGNNAPTATTAAAAAAAPTAAVQGTDNHNQSRPQQAAAAGLTSSRAEQQQQQQQNTEQREQHRVVSVMQADHAPNAAKSPAAATIAADAGDVQDAAAAAAAAGLPSALVSAVQELQQRVVEHKPSSGTSNAMNKPVKHALKAVGFTFLLLPDAQQQQYQDALLQVVTPLMLPYGKERKVRKEMFEVPKVQLADIDEKENELMKQLEDMKTTTGSTDDEDFQRPNWPAAAESSLVAAWKAAEGQTVGNRLQHMAIRVMSILGRHKQQQQEPEKALEELRQLYHKAKKKVKKEKKVTDSQGTAAATASAGTSQPSTAAAAPLTQQPSASSIDTVPSAQGQSPEPSAAAAATSDAIGRSSTPSLTPLKTKFSSVNLATGDDTAAAAGDVVPSQVKKEQEKLSMPSAPSPRLQRCLTAAAAAGAPRDWLEQSCPKPSSANLAQIFRVLCLVGPQGCTVKNMVAAAAEHGLGFSWEDSTNQRSSINQSLHTQLGRNIVGLAASEPPAYALSCFEGVRPQPQKPPKQPKSSADAVADPTAAAGGADVDEEQKTGT